MTKVSRKSARPAEDASLPVLRKLRSKGSLNPSEPEVTVYAGLKDGAITATPAIQIKTKAVSHLATDNGALADAIAHKLRIEGDELNSLATRVSRLGYDMRLLPFDERDVAVAGSLELIDIALQDAFKVLLFTDEAKPELPPEFNGWKASKPDSRSTPAVITLTRE